jgi:hypothetical protein
MYLVTAEVVLNHLQTHTEAHTQVHSAAQHGAAGLCVKPIFWYMQLSTVDASTGMHNADRLTWMKPGNSNIAYRTSL